MAADGTRDGQDVSRRIREELERIRDSEARVEEALEAVRQARRRVEVIARELGREEERVRAWVREEMRTAAGPTPSPSAPGSSPGSVEAGGRSWRTEPGTGWASWRDVPPRGPREAAAPPQPVTDEGEDTSRRPAAPETERRPSAAAVPLPAPTGRPPSTPRDSARGPSEGDRSRAKPLAFLDDRRLRFALMAAGAALLVFLVGWFAIRGLRQGAPEPAPQPGLPIGGGESPDPAAPAESPAAAPTAVLASLPADPAAREALYDSLWSARSPLFAPMIAVIREESDDADVESAADAWAEGAMDAEESDLLHSAFLQHVLNQRIDQRVDIDGQVLRNPCRGGSCSALLNLWQVQGDEYGLPPIPDDAPTNTEALRRVETALVLDWMRDVNGVAEAPGA